MFDVALARQQPIDYAMHPVAGKVLVAWGLLTGALTLLWRDASRLHLISGLLMALGIAVLGAALLSPPGTGRRWLIRAVFACILAWIVVHAAFAVDR